MICDGYGSGFYVERFHEIGFERVIDYTSRFRLVEKKVLT